MKDAACSAEVCKTVEAELLPAIRLCCLLLAWELVWGIATAFCLQRCQPGSGAASLRGPDGRTTVIATSTRSNETHETGWAGLQIGHLSGVCHLRRASIVTGTCSGASIGHPAGCMLRLAACSFLLSVCNRFFSQDRPACPQQLPLQHLCGYKACTPGVHLASGCLVAASQNCHLPSFCLKRHVLPGQGICLAAGASLASLW